MEKIKVLRMKNGWTQTELAGAAEVPQSTVSKLEAGTLRVISPKAMKRIADALGKEITDIEEFAAKLAE